MLQVDQVSLQRGRFSLLENLSFEVQAGERIALFGQSGSGKTLLFRLLNGLATPNQGRIIFQGQDIAQSPPAELRRQVAWVAFPPRLFGMSVREAIAYPLQLQSLPESEIQARLTHASEQFDWLTDWLEKSEANLSQEQQYCVAIARAWVMKPLLMLLEWPNEEGPRLQQTALSLMQNLQNQDRAIIIATHHPAEQWEWGKAQDWTQLFHLGRNGQPRHAGTSIQSYALKGKMAGEKENAWHLLTAQFEKEAKLSIDPNNEDWSDDIDDDF